MPAKPQQKPTPSVASSTPNDYIYRLEQLKSQLDESQLSLAKKRFYAIANICHTNYVSLQHLETIQVLLKIDIIENILQEF